MHKEIWFVNDDMATGYKTHIDRDRYKRIIARRDDLDERMKADGDKIRARWAAAHKTLVSEMFWIKFLGLDPKDYGYDE